MKYLNHPSSFSFILVIVFLLSDLMKAHHDHQSQHLDSLTANFGKCSLIKIRLHSHDIRIARGGIYSVTAYKHDDHGSFWQVLEQYDLPVKTKTYKDAVKCGDNIMLYSSIVDYYLRTEDTTFGLTTELLPLVHGVKPDQLDHGIVWDVHCVDKEQGQDVHFGDKIRIKHDTSGKYVSTDGSSYYTEGNCGRGCEIAGHLELHAVDNGIYSEDTIFQIVGGLAFDQTKFEKEGEQQVLVQQ